jgi:plastocyanin
VRLRRRFLFLLAALLGAAVAVLPAVAGSETSPTIEVLNIPTGYEPYEYHAWLPAQTTVTAGGVVTLRNPWMVAHGVEWRPGAPATPTCSSGVPVGNSEAASATNWSGTCTFAKPGTYTFWCTVHHAEMTGTIKVNANGTTTTSPGGGSTTTPGSSGSAGSPLAGSASKAVKLSRSQRGKSVHGSVKVSKAGAGGRLEVILLAKSASLAKAGRSAQVVVGRLVRSGLRAGTVSFNVPLSAKANRALARHRRLALTVKIILTPKHGSAVTVTRSVVLHA